MRLPAALITAAVLVPAAASTAHAQAPLPPVATEITSFRLTDTSLTEGKDRAQWILRVTKEARVRIDLERRYPGAMVGGDCVQPRVSNRGAPRCARWLPTGKIRFRARTGLNARPFSGRVGRKHLVPATYRATVIPEGGGTTRTVQFRIKAR